LPRFYKFQSCYFIYKVIERLILVREEFVLVTYKYSFPLGSELAGFYENVSQHLTSHDPFCGLKNFDTNKLDAKI